MDNFNGLAVTVSSAIILLGSGLLGLAGCRYRGSRAAADLTPGSGASGFACNPELGEPKGSPKPFLGRSGQSCRTISVKREK
jgi:hypothetical protein